eukprot:jgi/Botrbrau1/12150/Bobra.0186s0062.2
MRPLVRSQFFKAWEVKTLGRSFHYDKVFGPDSTQEKLYTNAIAPIVDEVLEGFNCTIFAYGQTGTGKTYTMEGGERSSSDGTLSDVAGVIPRAISQIFQTLDSNDSEYTVKCSFLELYNEESSDLLAVGDARDQKLRMLEDKSGVVVQGLEEMVVKTSADIYALLDRGSAKRRTAETLLNKQSSRSHSVFCITVHIREYSADGEEVIKIGKLYLVDLAGSENVSRSGAVDVRAKEAGLINKSLLTLGRVITALVEGQGHVPYRDSKLTRLLRDSLGGRTKTCIIATIAPTVQCQEETLSTLDYAHRAKNIRNRPEVNQKISKTAHIKELNAEMDRLKAELFATREKNGVYIPVDQYQQQELASAAACARVEALELELEAIKETHQSLLDGLRSDLQATQQELLDTYNALQAAKTAIQERDFMIATLERAETALAGHADHLTLSLVAAAGDLQAVVTRLEQNGAREARNAAFVRQLGTSATSSLESLITSVQDRLTKAKESYVDIATSVDNVLKHGSQGLKAVLGTLTQIEEQVSTHGSICSRHMHALADLGNTNVQNFYGQASLFVHETEEALKAAVDQFETAHTTFLASVSCVQALQSSYMTEYESAASDILGSMKMATADAHSAFVSSAEAAKSHSELTSRAYDMQNTALKSFEDDFKRNMALEQGELVQQLTALVNNYSSRREGHVQKVLSQIRDRIECDKEQTSTLFGALQEGSLLAATTLQAQEEHLVNMFDSMSRKQADQACTMSKAQDKLVSDGSNVYHSARQSHESLTQSLGLFDQRASEIVAVALHEVTAMHDNVGNEISQGIETQLQTCTGLRDEASKSFAAQESLCKELLKNANVGQAADEELALGHLESIKTLESGIHAGIQDTFEADPHEGESPLKPTIAVPQMERVTELRAPCADVLLSEFRRQKQPSQEKPGPLAQIANAFQTGARLEVPMSAGPNII